MSVDLKLVKELRDRTSLGMNDCKKALEQSNGDMEAAIDLLKKWGELKGKERANKIATEGRIAVSLADDNYVGSIVEINCQTDFAARNDEFIALSENLAKDFVEKSYSTAADAYIGSDDRLKELAAKTGENIVVRRNETFSTKNLHGYISSYEHPGNRLCVLIEAITVSDAARQSEEFRAFVSDCAMQVAAMAPIAVSKDDIPAEMLVRQRKIFEAQLEDEKKPQQAWQKIIEGKFAKWRKEIVLLEQDSIKDPKKTIEQIRQELSGRLGEITIRRFARYSLGEGLEKSQEDYAAEVAKIITSTKNA